MEKGKAIHCTGIEGSPLFAYDHTSFAKKSLGWNWCCLHGKILLGKPWKCMKPMLI